MKMRKNIKSFLLGSLLCVACEESFHKPLMSEDTNLLVVEGVLTNEKIKHLIKLTTPYQSQNGIPTPVSGAIIQITDETNTYPLTELPIGSGQYYTPEIRAVVGKTYTLQIQYG